eukprot:CAMPEP_0169481844 /NCGR_PEP_ID=MMETSP1042-20121227/30347_1 /TAXON_ID=464988 /ORGANISM="Hemiselmis andersenii, Strain CCMP1180" /LENGTH=170 /DNA_ID=CAMNT_0009596649 /DNA_START=88 /DNA_END=597 /DNA_ORIENTATION=-
MSPTEVAAQTPQLLRECGDWPNTYTLTKHMGEALFSSLASQHSIPSIVIRPTIITCASSYPSVGWTDTLIGPAGLVLAVAFGVLHVAPGKEELIVDFVPVDYVVNTLLISTLHCASRPPPGRQTPDKSVSENPVSWGCMLKVMPGYYSRHPSPKTLAPIHFRWARGRAKY